MPQIHDTEDIPLQFKIVMMKALERGYINSYPQNSYIQTRFSEFSNLYTALTIFSHLVLRKTRMPEYQPFDYLLFVFSLVFFPEMRRPCHING